MILVLPAVIWADKVVLDARILEDFSLYTVGETPSKLWRARGGEAKGIYTVLKEENKLFLRAKTKDDSVQVFREVQWNIKKHPWLTWQWRARQFPQGANEVKGPNDSVLGLYVVFPKRFFVPETIKYVWSSEVEEETVIERHKRFPTVVIRSGEALKDQWLSEQRNVREDYHRLFGRYPGNPVAIGFLSDANSTLKGVEGDYGPIQVQNQANSSVTTEPNQVRAAR